MNSDERRKIRSNVTIEPRYGKRMPAKENRAQLQNCGKQTTDGHFHLVSGRWAPF